MFLFFSLSFFLWQTRFFVFCLPIFLSMSWNLDETLSVIEEAVLSILLRVLRLFVCAFLCKCLPPEFLSMISNFCSLRKSSFFWCGLSLCLLLSCSLQDTAQTSYLMSKSAVDYILLFQCSHIWGCEQRARRIGRPLKQIPEVHETIQVWDPFLSFSFLFRAVRAILSDFIF